MRGSLVALPFEPTVDASQLAVFSTTKASVEPHTHCTDWVVRLSAKGSVHKGP